MRESIGPEGSFFGLIEEEVVLDDEELERELSEIDRLSPLFSDCRVCDKHSLNMRYNFVFVFYQTIIW